VIRNFAKPPLTHPGRYPQVLFCSETTPPPARYRRGKFVSAQTYFHYLGQLCLTRRGRPERSEGGEVIELETFPVRQIVFV